MKTKNLEIVKQTYSYFREGNIQAIIDLHSEDITWKEVGAPDLPMGGIYHGKAGLGEFFKKLDEAIEFQVFEPREFIADHDKVVVLGYAEALAKGTGKPISLEWVHIHTLRDDKIAEHSSYYDSNTAAKAFRS